MNKRKVTKCKGSKPKNNSDPNEVFVLPPNLLEKLGINLGSIGSTPEFTTDYLVSDKKTISNDVDIGQKKHIISNSSDNYVKTPSQNESSIIETANLMKESVFLSPTFISNSTCAIQGEVEIVGNADLKNIEITEINLHKNDDYDLCSNEMREEVALNIQENPVTEKKMQNPINDKTPTFIVNIDKEYQPTNTLGKVDNIKNDTGKDMEDHTDESYASDCSISNKGSVNKTDSSYLLQESGKNQIKNKKISIISEQILDPAQLRELICCAPTEKSLVPVTVNILVNTQCRKSISHENYIDLNFIPDIYENSIDKEGDKSKQNCVSQNLCTDEDINSNLKLSKVFKSPESNVTGVDCNNFLAKDNYETFIVTQKIEDTCPVDNTTMYIDAVEKYNNESDKSMVIPSNTSREDNSIKSKTDTLHKICIDSYASKSECDENEVNSTLEIVSSNVMGVIKSDAYNNHLKISTEVSPAGNTFEVIDDQKSKPTLKDDEIGLKVTEIALSSKNSQSNGFIYDGSSQNEYDKREFQFEQEDDAIKNKIKQSEDFSKVKLKEESKTVALHKNTSVKTNEITQQHHSQKNKAKVHKHDKPQSEVQITTIGTSNKMKSQHDTKLAQVKKASPIQEEQVREIAKYLSQFADIQRRKSVDEKHNRKQANNSKLSIQGVEKPGGTKKSKHYRNGNFGNVKTYVRKQKTTPTITSKQNKSNRPHNFYKHNTDIDLVIQPNQGLVNLYNKNEFCMCDDFGRLIYYDEDCQYKHIHFWKENNIDCTRDVVFSIYDEDGLVNVYEDKEGKVIDMAIDSEKNSLNAISIGTDHKLCWNEINTSGDKSPVRENEGDENVENSFNESTKKVSQEIKKLSLYEEISTETPVCNGTLTTCAEIQCDNNVLTIDAVVNSDESTGNKVNSESGEHPKTNGKKRKWSTRLDKSEEPLAKKSAMLNSIESVAESDKITTKQTIAEGEHAVTDLPDIGVGASVDQPSTSCSKASIATCGVCRQDVKDTDWLQHIASEHNYMSWKVGELALDLENREMVVQHLSTIVKQIGALLCNKCGLTRKYAKAFLHHIKQCGVDEESHNESALNVTSDLSELESARPVRVPTGDVNRDAAAPSTDVVTECGLCGEAVPSKHWNTHRELKHNYLAWKCGEQSLDINDEEAVKNHLYDISKECGGLKCSKCGLTRKYVKSYLTHFKSCIGPSESQNDRTLDISLDFASVVDSVGRESDSRCSIHVKTETAPVDDGPSKCGVCGEPVGDTEWNSHRESRHNYMAWKCGEPVLDLNDENAVKEHLHVIAKECGGLKCAKCGLIRKYVKSYMAHVDSCNGFEPEDENTSIKPEPGVTGAQCEPARESSTPAGSVKCGVCGEDVPLSDWMVHNTDQHDYLAWKHGEPPLNVNIKKQVYQHLCDIMKETGALYCKKCGKKRKVVKNYLDHIKLCGQDVCTTKDTTFEADSSLDLNESRIDFDSGGSCGVCKSEVEPGKWIQHTQKHHNYLAWRQDEKPWDLDDPTEVGDNLYEIAKKMGGLTCNKCGLVRKYVKTYLTHIKTCSVIDFNINSTEMEGIGPVSLQDNFRCAMCQEEIKPSKWKAHAMGKHYNITWVIGETPIDLKNPYAVERYLKEYRQTTNNLKCHTCGATRASYAGFYAHIITCGKTEEQTEMFKSICEICNNKYLCIYKNQHMMMHRVQDYSKELKSKKADATKEEDVEEVIVSGKRRAAQKARSVIENYSNDLSKHPYKCESCGFGSDFKEELQSHTCDKSNENEFSGDERSEADVGDSDDESPESAVDSDISMEENEEPKKKGQERIRIPRPVPSKVARLSFTVKKPQTYLLESDKDFCNGYLTDDTLFPQWLSSEREVVSENELTKYLPSMETSCKVKSGFDWTTLKRFEVKVGDGQVLFVGGCIISLTWAPLRVGDTSSDHNFLAVACHNGVDSPRFQCDETPRHENLIQLWDFGECKGLPKLVYGIAHDLGTVWSVDWCPSGAREILPEDLEDDKIYRLGLLAVACSSGSAYILSVPYPATAVKDDKFVQKFKPVAELRMTMRSDRKLYQATSVTWSKQKGHAIVLVGYGDGSLAYYDLNCSSPLLKTVEDNVEVFYPYYDERPHNTCVLDADLFPAAGEAGGAGGAGGAGATCSAGATGAELAAGAARVRSQLAAHAVIFAPHWPGVMLAGDVTIMNTAMNELEWVAPARRLGGARALAPCARCGLLAAATPPALRVMRPHPAYPDYRKQVVGTLEMTPLGSKRKKQVNDELGMILEPLTYDEAIAKYGIEFKAIKKTDKQAQHQGGTKPRTNCPERFPLADVTSMAFCPSKKHHDKLAIASHAGLIFFMKVDT